MKALQLEYYLKRLQSAQITHGASVDLDSLISRFGKAATSSREEAQAFAGNLEDPEALIAAVERLTRYLGVEVEDALAIAESIDV